MDTLVIKEEIQSSMEAIPRFFIFSSFLLFVFFCKPSSQMDWQNSLEARFQEIAKKHSKSAQILVTSPKRGFFFKSAYESSPDQPFHGASIAKLATAVLVLQLVEENLIQEDTKIASVLPKQHLEGLFLWEGRDISDKVTVLHLLEHTSGVADYFDSEDIEKSSFVKRIVEDPNQFFHPKDLLEEAKKQKKMHNQPGDGFFYSDTGYVLLGLLIESVTKKSYEKNLEERIFKKLGMADSYIFLRSKPLRNPSFSPASISLLGKDISKDKGLSADWAGGGIVFTTQDLEAFLRGLWSGKLLPLTRVAKMSGDREFHSGIFYGKGMMKVDFSKISILMPKAPLFYGHSGVLGTLAFYSPDEDIFVVANFGNPSAIENSFEYLFYSGFEGSGVP